MPFLTPTKRIIIGRHCPLSITAPYVPILPDQPPALSVALFRIIKVPQKFHPIPAHRPFPTYLALYCTLQPFRHEIQRHINELHEFKIQKKALNDFSLSA
jgi:hypothetical protein